MRGRKPIPDNLKVLYGNRGKRPIGKDSPKPKSPERLPPAPEHMGEDGKKEWKRMGKELLKMGVLHKVGLPGLAAYCCAYEQWISAYRNVIKEGTVVMTPNGFYVQNPHMTIAKQQQAEMRKWMIEFGVTPSSMTKVKVTDGAKGKEKKSEAGEFFTD